MTMRCSVTNSETVRRCAVMLLLPPGGGSYNAEADVFYTFRGNALLPSCYSKCTFSSYSLRLRKGRLRCFFEISETAHLDTVPTIKSRINVSFSVS